MDTSTKRKVCVVLVDRANYGRMKPVMEAIQAHAELTLQVIAAGTMVLERFQKASELVRKDGFPIDGEIFIELEGSNPITMSKSVGFGVIEFTNEFQRLQPDVVLLIGDRYEMLAAAIAAAFMNLCMVHIQGGEVSGSIDESTRHAISKFSHFHFPSTKKSADNLVRMGENPETILGIGCPSGDIVRTMDRRVDPKIINEHGSGAIIDVSHPFLLVVFHPTTTEYGTEVVQIKEVLGALNEIKMPTVMLWPNIDAGSDHISKEIRVFRNREKANWLRIITNVSPEHYLKILANTACAVGNSSSFVRDASFLGTPVVLVGKRQEGRERDQHVLPVPAKESAIKAAIRLQLSKGQYPPSELYGNGYVAPHIAECLARLKPYVQKQLYYVTDEVVRENVEKVHQVMGRGKWVPQPAGDKVLMS